MATRQILLMTPAAICLAACQQPVEQNAALQLEPVIQTLPEEDSLFLAELQDQHILDFNSYKEAVALREYFSQVNPAENQQIVTYFSNLQNFNSHIQAYQIVQVHFEAEKLKAEEQIGYDEELVALFEEDDIEALDNSDLGEIRGAAALTNATFSLQEAIGAHNNCLNCRSGGNVIDGSSFNENSGLTNVILNTGNNAVIQNATTVSITLVRENAGIGSAPVNTQSLVQ